MRSGASTCQSLPAPQPCNEQQPVHCGMALFPSNQFIHSVSRLFICAERRIAKGCPWSFRPFHYDLSRVCLLTNKVGHIRLTFSSSPFVLMEQLQTLNSAGTCPVACHPTQYWLTICATRALSAFLHLQEQKLCFFLCLCSGLFDFHPDPQIQIPYLE